MYQNKILLEDMPKGNLDYYRKQAKFDWKKLKLELDEPEHLAIKMKIWKTLSMDPLFRRPEADPPTDDQKKIAAKRILKYMQYNFLPKDIIQLPYMKRTRLMMVLQESLAAVYPDIAIKHGVGVGLFKNTLSTLGTERHKHILEASWDNKIIACLALTEIGHGSNTKQMQTVAKYDKNTKEFILNTPDFQAAKCWAGNLGKTCTWAILFAQLQLDGQNMGLHAFVVPIRCPKTLRPFNGITVGDMGEKIGLHGIDNGFLMFKNYRVPREYLLNRVADVTPEGEYVSNFSEPGKILGAALENLSAGRVSIMQTCLNTLIRAITIAIRYGASRKQFSVDGKSDEDPLLEYQLHQWRLFPHVATAIVLKMFVNSFTYVYLNAVEKSNSAEDQFEDINHMISEIHALVSIGKPMVTFSTRDAIQECREACGGFGYLKCAGFGDMRNDNDPCVTYEGDNHVLLQQTVNWLLKQYHRSISGKMVESPLGSCSFLQNYAEIRNKKFIAQNVQNVSYIMECLEWLIVYLLDETDNKKLRLMTENNNKYVAKNCSLVFHGLDLSKIYGIYNTLRYFHASIQKIPQSMQEVLNSFGVLYGLHHIDKYLAYFYQGNFCNGSDFSKNVKGGILQTCSDIKPNVVAIIDALAPPDFVINSVLGKADGKIYESLQTYFFSHSNLQRPKWWKEVIIPNADIPKIKNKL